MSQVPTAAPGATGQAPPAEPAAAPTEAPAPPVQATPPDVPAAAATAPGAAELPEGSSAADSATPPGAASHDPQQSGQFRAFMAGGWAAPERQLPHPEPVAAHAARRRQALIAAFPGEALVVPSGSLKVRANDTDYPFRPQSDFTWLTGSLEPDAVLIVDVNGASVLYLAGRSDRSSSAFYSDRRYGELWVGPRRGVAETAAALQIECRPLTELPTALGRLAPGTTRVLRGVDQRVDERVLARPSGGSDAELATVLSELRLRKDSFELAELQAAVDSTVTGFSECIAAMPYAARLDRGERWLEGTFWRRARLDGNDVGYGSIVACGPHATTLHWVRNDGPVRPDDLALLDMGVERDSLYTADVTRTVPIDGTWRDAQRRVYDVVRRAQLAGIEAVRPGADFLAPHRAAMAVIAEALDDWGLLPVPAAESLREEVGLHRRYTLHGTSHMLGLDVHDCAEARAETYRDGPLAPGMVLTVEPGLYFQADDLTVPADLRGIGVRIEDDVVVTESGCQVLSEALPRDADEIESWVRDLQQG